MYASASKEFTSLSAPNNSGIRRPVLPDPKSAKPSFGEFPENEGPRTDLNQGTPACRTPRAIQPEPEGLPRLRGSGSGPVGGQRLFT